MRFPRLRGMVRFPKFQSYCNNINGYVFVGFIESGQKFPPPLSIYGILQEKTNYDWN
jgi:hypothetical protein